MILLAAGIINRILGFVPRITLPRVIGAEGVGLYQLGYPFLIVVITIITGGIPVAVAKLVAEAESEGNERRVRAILKVSLALTVTIGLMLTVLCAAAAGWITSALFTDPRVYPTFLAMSPMIVIVSISAVFRGYFQGRQNMIPTAASTITETTVRIVAMLLFAWWLLPYGIEFAAAGAMFGVTIGEVSGMLVLLFQYLGSRKQYKAYHKAVIGSGTKTPTALSMLRRLLKIAVPVTGSRLVGSASYFFESILTVQSLAAAGIASRLATAQYGALQGMVIPLLLMPSALTYSLATSLVPSLSEASARNDYRTIHKRLGQSLRLALVTGAPFAVLMYVLAEPMCLFLYGDREAGKMLQLMAPVALFIYLQAPLQATLQALDRPGSALMNTFAGACVKLTLIIWLGSNPSFGIYGVLLAINANIILVTLLHWISVKKLLKFSMKLGDFVKVAAGMCGTALLCDFVYNRSPLIGSEFLQFVTASVCGLAAYLVMMIGLKMIDKQDLARIPGIRRWIKR